MCPRMPYHSMTRKQKAYLSYNPGIFYFLNKIQVKRVLVDPGSSANTIRSRVVEQLGPQDQIVPASRVLNSNNIENKTTKGEIILLVNVAGTIQDKKFHVIEGDIRYNILLERP